MDTEWPRFCYKRFLVGLFILVVITALFLFLKVGALNLTPPPSSKAVPLAEPPQTEISLLPLTRDADNDGFPDVAQLQDPQDNLRFRRWFCALAEAQYYRLSPAWEPSQRDCAGLLRYAYKEALRKHDLSWQRAAELKGLPPMEEVAAFNYPQIPLLGEKLFRTGPGPLKTPNLPFAAFADAQALKDFNLAYLGKTPSQIREGDILIFYRPENPEMPYHLMVYLKHSLIVTEEQGAWLVYHTGPTLRPTKSPGEMRKRSWEELKAHPDPTWHPVTSNPNFLGFYKWKILAGG